MSVVPYVGTWIEIQDVNWMMIISGSVVPYVGTWIEMQIGEDGKPTQIVVPYVGTWIEMQRMKRWFLFVSRSFPTWERG